MIIPHICGAILIIVAYKILQKTQVQLIYKTLLSKPDNIARERGIKRSTFLPLKIVFKRSHEVVGLWTLLVRSIKVRLCRTNPEDTLVTGSALLRKELAQWLNTLAVFAEDLGLISSSPMVAHNLCNSIISTAHPRASLPISDTDINSPFGYSTTHGFLVVDSYYFHSTTLSLKYLPEFWAHKIRLQLPRGPTPTNRLTTAYIFHTCPSQPHCSIARLLQWAQFRKALLLLGHPCASDHT